MHRAAALATDPLLDAHKRTRRINRHKLLRIMSARCPTASLEPFLGTYRIVWDSHSNYDPRDVLLDHARPAAADRDPCDGLLTLSRPQRAHAWPKEPTPSSPVVLTMCDAFLGIDRAASFLKASPRPVHAPAPTSSSSSSFSSLDTPSLSPASLRSSASASRSSLLSPFPTPSPSPSPVSRPSSSLSIAAPSLRSPLAPGAGAWRIDWDPAFPRLGFRFEGMDLTAAHGHALSFSHIRDDRGCPFVVVDLRPAGWGEPGAEGRMGRRNDRDTDTDTDGEQCYIVVVAKRVPDRYAREGLSEAERVRLGMVELGDLSFD
ncbi:hypothetical protein C8Q78DRAFT_541583 [Trametes maxima]|nr:hypothetical protein C8Q78DRAFT_541583 [Trametes maxima]